MADYDAGASGLALGAEGVEAPDEQKFDVSGDGLTPRGYGVGFWTPFPYEGLRWLKVLNTGTANPYASQATLDIGTEYRLIGYGLSDGYGLPRIMHGIDTLWTGIAHTVWQEFDITFTATTDSIRFVGANTSTGQWVGFDFCSCETTLPLVDVACFTAEVVEPLPLGFNVEELGRILQETTLGGVKSYLICRPPNPFSFDTPGQGFDQAPYGGTF